MGKVLAKLEARDVFFRLLDERLDKSMSKSIKEELEKLIIPPECLWQPIVKKSKMNEMAGTRYIFDRIKEFADNYPQLDVYDNRSALLYSRQNFFSKYSKSRPDITALKNNVVIFNQDNQKSLVVIAEDDVDDVDTKMNPISLTVEAKLKEGVNLGQVLAGMEKTYADLLYNELKSVKPDEQLLPAGIVMYGMHITYETNQCILVKAELKIGKSTVVRNL